MAYVVLVQTAWLLTVAKYVDIITSNNLAIVTDDTFNFCVV